MKVKICGITTKESAQAACEAGADMLGFVFAESTRKITPEAAREIVDQLPQHVAAVGVFVNETVENIEQIAETAGLDYIQLHGDEPPEFCGKLSRPIIKAFTIREKDDAEKLFKYECDYYLVDSPGIRYRGGSGMPFDWSLLQNQNIPRGKMILAGGLNEANVTEAIDMVQPSGVDVSSGVETDGQKDLKKIFAFVKTAKQL
ncbi:phosphoribosylanthranilate isomerase [Siminovitchia acidinfaciens]|uniref:N-(5'-phosphoribosyl)anthranilate isomerase n=1 Tax=Siminovitchia acidinfaciens TaxID=2321395 RepID=A0A429Y7U8_9BACI|nr:phosphoribosylanthranilate isomerase [Siminovitchia acidinfaciens]RST77458.1 phosphoribosylanthranilate isomerase [Siminovitchia acidinfaciens]